MELHRKIPSVLLLFVIPAALYPITFKFVHREGDNYRIVTEVYETVKQDNRIMYTTEILNRIAVSVEASDGDTGQIDAIYQISEKAVGETGYHWSSEEKVQFSRDSAGRYSGLGDSSALPAVRDVPRFPDKDISPGEEWNFPGEEVHDLEPFFGIRHLLRIPFRAFYRYEGTVEEEGRVLDKIVIGYHIYYEKDRLAVYLEHPDWGEVFPEKIVGSFYQEYYWNREEGRPARVEDRFEYKYYLTTDRTYTFSGVSFGKVASAEQMDREEMVEEIARELEENGIEDIQVASEEEGVRITLEDIRFLPDSPVLEESEIPKLERISEILMRYRDRDILITGHTARFGTEESSQRLSEQRASAVAAYLLEMRIREESEIVTRGFGSRRPVGDNSTIEGQKLNRRVEITILEN